MRHAVDAQTGLMQGARYQASPHCDARPPGTQVDLLVIHGISLPPGEFGGPWIERLFLGTLPADAHPYFADIAALKVASHLLIRRDGGLLQFVPFHRRAWHAGSSRFQGREACNDFSIGVELEGTDEIAYAPEQYARLALVTAGLMRAYPAITPARIVGHSDVAPGRKTDPGAAFDWARYRDILASQPRHGFTTQP
ncbi:MAG: 1,6-anhydro-N-acetylmuramyl-L-alanine amidase AmpD [Gammaproteobacteria bacterium]